MQWLKDPALGLGSPASRQHTDRPCHRICCGWVSEAYSFLAEVLLNAGAEGTAQPEQRWLLFIVPLGGLAVGLLTWGFFGRSGVSLGWQMWCWRKPETGAIVGGKQHGPPPLMP